jgi:hypothetical protein
MNMIDIYETEFYLLDYEDTGLISTNVVINWLQDSEAAFTDQDGMRQQWLAEKAGLDQ